MNLYEKVVEYVANSFKGKQSHFERTVYWLEKILPNITDTERIAAYSHDIERAFRDNSKPTPDSFCDEFYLRYHPEKGAEIIGEFLIKNGADNETINKVKHLVSTHEVGGDYEQNALMDADAISFFETNAQNFVRERTKIESKAKIKEKLDWMFNRINTEEHREFARENYEKWSKELDLI
ncbi:MAG: DUF4202 family protein [Candidatus Paceibacterota bacterium]|jgi:hypothetical protein